MSFISLKFALFVIICLLVYYICPKRFRWVVLLVASYVFYAICSLKVIEYIIITTITTYIASCQIEKIAVGQKAYIKEHKDLSKDEKKAYKSKCKNKQRLILWSVIILNIGFLAFLKYIQLGVAYYNYYRLMWFGITDFKIINVVMPLGVSFYTFQSVGYLSDIFNSKFECEKNFFKYALFVSFFPQIIQGPISRFNELSETLYCCPDFDFYRIKSGFVRIIWGLFKKLVIADRLAPYVRNVMELREYNFEGFYVLMAVFFYSMQIYGDFSGGIDVTIGVAEMFGVNVTENFERPFFSKSISEYWRRWHITLGTWFKDYIFYPLSLWKPFLNLGKWVKNHINEGLGKRVPLYLPLIIVWTTTGMWHGSESRYVVWGLLNLFFVILGTETEGISEKLINKYKINVEGFCFKFYRVVKTFWLMSFLRLFDINKNTERAIAAFKSIFRGWSYFKWEEVYGTLGLKKEDLIVALVAIVFMFVIELIQRSGSIRNRIFKLKPTTQLIIVTAFSFVVIIFGYYGLGFDSSSFIYGEF
ncbi:MAG: MBOAT family O-acyltransferase [Lachnospiraceae bacterium]|nr:MBOAT family O-acyltransferase [Lachnospiraceae bacterium]